MLHGSLPGGRLTVDGQWPAYARKNAFGGGVTVKGGPGCSTPSMIAWNPHC